MSKKDRWELVYFAWIIPATILIIVGIYCYMQKDTQYEFINHSEIKP